MKRIIILFIFSLIGFGCSSQNKDSEYYLKSGQKSFLAGKYSEATNFFLDGLKHSPSNHELLYYTGLSYQKEYMYDSSLFYLKKVDLLFPHEREINLAIYQVAPKVKDWENSIKAIKVLIKSGDKEEKYWKDFIQYYGNREMYVNSMYYLRKVIPKEPENIEPYLQMCNFSALAESLETAQAYNDTAVDKFGYLDELKSNQGTILAFRGELKKAEKIFRELFNLDTTNIYYKTNLASTLSEQKNISKKKEALKLFEEVRLQTSANSLQLDSIVNNLKKEIQK
ncbi:MAG: hypothetical protein DRP35_01300 [Candidatus Zixiibacteriota bacterium]|nr:MAG: hypothetical protein DRP35_01300 [candidate division Zixibacteria bacterium]